MKYRSRIEIVSQILEVANGGTNKTKIMYRGYLSYAQLKEYLAVLMEEGLLEPDSANRGQFRTTEKGIQFLKAYQQLSDMMRIVGDSQKTGARIINAVSTYSSQTKVETNTKK